MARIRTIKPEFWLNENLASVSEPALLLAAALLNYADDDGFFNANPMLIKASCFPLRELSVSIHGALSELSRIGYVELRVAPDGRQYGQVVKFAIHQRINRPSESKISAFWDSLQVQNDTDSVIAHGVFSESSVSPHPRKGNGNGNGTGNGSGTGETNKRFTPPTVEQLGVYFSEIGLDESPKAFLDYYQSKGWKVGNTPMKDWRAAARTWLQRRKAEQPKPKRRTLTQEELEAIQR